MLILQVTAMWFGVTAHRLGRNCVTLIASMPRCVSVTDASTGSDPMFYRLNLYRKTIPHERPVSGAGAKLPLKMLV